MGREDDNAKDATARDELAVRSDPDADILAHVERGDREAALRLLMARHGRMVWSYCREQLGDNATADDVHQRVFIEADRDLPKFGQRSALRTWLFGIARHRVLDAVKARNRERKRVEYDDSVEVADPVPATEVRLDEARFREALDACMAELPETTREAVTMRYQGFSFEEMSEIFDEKPGTLQARVARVVKRLHACIVKRTGASP